MKLSKFDLKIVYDLLMMYKNNPDRVTKEDIVKHLYKLLEEFEIIISEWDRLQVKLARAKEKATKKAADIVEKSQKRISGGILKWFKKLWIE